MRPESGIKQPIGMLLLGGVLVAAGLAVAPAASAQTSAAALARQILDARDQGKISIVDYSADPARDRADRSLASQQLEDIAAGQPAHLSTRCSYAAQYPPSRTVAPDVRVLQFLAELGQQSTYKLNVLFGQCHKAGAHSMHHQGKAVDLGCPLNTTTPDTVGNKYDVKRNSETCAADQHFHYSAGGR